MLKAQDNSNNLIATYVTYPQPIVLISSVHKLVIFFQSCSNKIRTIMIIITATMFKMYAVINITHHVFVMLSKNREQLNANSDFQNV